MLILILIDVQYSQKVVFSCEKGLNGQNHSSFPPPDQKSPSKVSEYAAYSKYAAHNKVVIIQDSKCLYKDSPKLLSLFSEHLSLN